MRLPLAALVALAALTPRPADACCVAVPCPETDRWRTLRLANDGPVPRDGVLLLQGWTDSERCTAELAQFLKIQVRRGDQLIAGSFEIADGNGWNFAWRPDAPWEPGAGYHVHAEIDNDAIGPSAPWPDGVPTCPEDCLDPPVIILDADFTVSTEFSPPLPALPAPALSLKTTRLNRTMPGITCCPGVVPGVTTDNCGLPPEVTWDAGCVEVHELRQLQVDLTLPVPPELSGQLVFELREGDVPIRRYTDPDESPWPLIRNSAACLQVVALHLGNGQTAASEVVCPSDQVAKSLGVFPVDVAAALACAGPVRCGVGELEWDPNACVPYDPLTLPTPPPAPKDSSYEPPCPLADGPWLTPEQVEGPTTSTGAPEPATTGTPGSATAGEDPLVDHGCACRGAAAPPPLSLLLLAPLLLPRRRRA